GPAAARTGQVPWAPPPPHGKGTWPRARTPGSSLHLPLARHSPRSDSRVGGAFGRCYELTDVSSGKVYAVKIIPQARLAELGNRQQMELHGCLRHRHVVGFHGHFADRSNVYVVLEYCGRRSLADILRARGTLTEPEVRYYLRQVVSGLRYLHGQGVVHRDLKPSHLFCGQNSKSTLGHKTSRALWEVSFLNKRDFKTMIQAW
uniref:Protein kinase domain-containing protein n=1 Tax=Apteryx owenii TaxID=8824 RepID=A0A8B9Q3D0_APTOW